jgi:hypothetical protein
VYAIICSMCVKKLKIQILSVANTTPIMPAAAVINCIDNAFRVWSNPKLYSSEFSNLSRELRETIKNKTSDRHQTLVITVYSWLCDSVVNPNGSTVTKGVRNAVRRLDVEEVFNAYVASIGCKVEPTPLIAAKQTAERSITLIDMDADMGASDPSPCDIYDPITIALATAPPPNYDITFNMVKYFCEKISMTPPERKMEVVFEKLLYLLDKVDYLAYDSECRMNILTFLDTAVGLCQNDINLYNYVELIRRYYLSNLKNIETNRFYRRFEL